jgi:hypothetical protein
LIGNLVRDEGLHAPKDFPWRGAIGEPKAEFLGERGQAGMVRVDHGVGVPGVLEMPPQDAWIGEAGD